MSRDGIRLTDPVRSILDAAGVGTAPEQIEMAVRQALDEGLVTRRSLLARADRRKRVASSDSSRGCSIDLGWADDEEAATEHLNAPRLYRHLWAR